MPNYISAIKLPNGDAYQIKDNGALQLTGGQVTGPVNFGDSVYVSDLNAGTLIVTGNAAFTNNIQVNTINGVEVGPNPSFTDTGTVSSVAVAATSNSGITINGSPITSVGTITIGLNLSDAINGLSEETSSANRNDYAVVQYAGGGTSTVSYHRRKLSNVFAALNSTDITNALGGTQSANFVFAGPSSGSVATPGFRTLVATDIPNLNANKITDGILPVARGGTGATSFTANSLIMSGTNATAALTTRAISTSITTDNSTNIPTESAVKTYVDDSISAIQGTVQGGYVTIAGNAQQVTGRKTFLNLAGASFKPTESSASCNISYNQNLGALVFSFTN